jgi:acetyl-CoA carboxylase biotin carboxyl carrier protein
VLLAARQTVGGYVKIATVIGADLDRLAQARPGDRVTFHEVSPEAAREATLAYLERLGPEAIIEEKLIFTGMSTRTDVTAAIDALSADSMWDPEGVERVIRAAEAAGVTTLRLSIASIGLTLELSRGPQAIVPPETSSPAASSLQTPESLITVTAPVLGVFYRRNGPDQPLLASEGEPVEEGQLLGLIEVMKTYHEVRAPQAGVLERFLVNDGQFVEYGQPVVQLSAA